MKRATILFLSVLVAVLWAADLRAQAIFFEQTRINSSPNPIGSGARAMGMGGAFIAVADDATAASWNPGGLMQLERPEFSFVFNFAHNRKELENARFPEMNGMNDINRDDLNYFSVALPFRAFDKNMVVSLNYQRLYDLYDDFSFNQSVQNISSVGGFTKVNRRLDFKQTGALKAFAPAWAIQITPRLSIGTTFNFWTDELGYDNEWESEKVESYSYSVTTPIAPNRVFKGGGKLITRERNTNFEAFNMNIGFLWHVNSVLTIGGVYKTPYTANFDRRVVLDQINFGSNVTGMSGIRRAMTKNRTVREEGVEMHFPSSYGLGVALRLSDEFTMSFDVYRTEWSDFWIRSGGRKTSPITGATRGEHHIHNTTQVRAGCEYLFVLEKTVIPVRFGLFYDPEPSEKHADDYYGVTAGTGILLGPVELDCAYIFRWGRDVKGDLIEVEGTKADIRQHNFYVSMIYHF